MGTQLPPEKGHTHLTQFLAHVYCGHGRPSQLLLSSCYIDGLRVEGRLALSQMNLVNSCSGYCRGDDSTMHTDIVVVIVTVISVSQLPWESWSSWTITQWQSRDFAALFAFIAWRREAAV